MSKDNIDTLWRNREHGDPNNGLTNISHPIFKSSETWKQSVVKKYRKKPTKGAFGNKNKKKPNNT